MKTLKLKILLLAGLISASFLSARAATPDNENLRSFRQKIQNTISLPEALKKPGYSKKVKMVFIVNENKAVGQVAAITSDPVLKSSLEAQFKKLPITELKPGTYNVEIDFNVY